jgi:hypothetical protein
LITAEHARIPHPFPMSHLEPSTSIQFAQRGSKFEEPYR